ncbi:MAG: Rpn family recombination-promoting nuclease/putative transposase [Lachnospiraceae bacterium]|nr:Rpn family recombination-promoting nuclease/putative transposase [Lachnospiraceae bacterium]
MGKKNIVWNRYLRNKDRFADLFNGVCFQGKSVIKAEMLTEISGIYDEHEAKKEELNERGEPIERIRDVQMLLNTGAVFRILALENQQAVHYAMPFRCMQYDTMEYGKQLAEIRKKNKEMGEYENAAEMVGKVKKTDRLTPVYTLCLYHGAAEWDGPRSLKDMMEFGDDADGMSKYFADYPMNLFCLNEKEEFSEFKTELKSVFDIMKLRNDKKKLKSEVTTKNQYQNMDLDTLEVVSVMLDAPWMWEERKKYMYKEEKVNMCQALQEWAEEERSIGIAAGKAEGKAESVLELLSDFGEVPEDLRQTILGQKDLEILRLWLKKAAKTESIEEFRTFLN